MNTQVYPLWALRKLVRAYNENGIGTAATLIRKNVAALLRVRANRRFDKRYGVDTSGIVQLTGLTCQGGNKVHGVWYEPTPLRTLECMFSMLPADVSDFTFIDFGSGKGRTLVYASRFAFQRIIGVEFTRELHEIAARNIRGMRNKNQRCFQIESVCADASTFRLPEGNCVLYFFHPFREQVMEKVLANVEESFRRNPRKLLLLYYHPQLNELMRRMDFLRKTGEKTMPLDISAEPSLYRRKIELYETVMACSGAAVGARR